MIVRIIFVAGRVVKRGNSKPSATLFVSNLSDSTTESDLVKAFDGCVDARIVLDTQTGRRMK